MCRSVVKARHNNHEDLDIEYFAGKSEKTNQDQEANSSVKRDPGRRKEKSRNAARERRGKEAEVFSDLTNEIPLPQNATAQLDKASIMRISIAYLKLRSLMEQGAKPEPPRNALEKKADQLFMKALEGFLMVISKEGDLVYLSETVTKYLGLSNVDFIGHSLFDFTHPCDHEEMREMLLPNCHHLKNPMDKRIFFMRMKCTLTRNGRNVNLKSATYKVIKCSGHLIPHTEELAMKLGLKDGKDLTCIALIGEPIPHPSNIEIPLDSRTFLSRHSMDMKYTFCDDRIQELVGYGGDDLIGKSVYEFHHALDSEEIERSYKTLFSKGQTVTGQYRFLAKDGGFVWVVTEGTVIYNSRNQKPQCVVCVNYVLSGIQQEKAIMSNFQSTPEYWPVADVGISRKTDRIWEPLPVDASGTKKETSKELFDKGTSMYDGPFFEDDPLCPYPMKKEPDARNESFRQYVQRSSESVCDMDSNCSSTPPSEQQHVSPADTPAPPEALQTPVNLDSVMLDRLKVSETGIYVDTMDNADDDEMEMYMRAPYIPMDSDQDFSLFHSSLLHPCVPDNENTGDRFARGSQGNALQRNKDPNSASGLKTMLCGPPPVSSTRLAFLPKTSQPPEPTHLPPMTSSTRQVLSSNKSLASALLDNTGKFLVKRRCPPPAPPPDGSPVAAPPAHSNLWVRDKHPLGPADLQEGPPLSKVLRLDTGQGQTRKDKVLASEQDQKSTVLMNLLLRGEDQNYGYRVHSQQPQTTHQKLIRPTQQVLMARRYDKHETWGPHHEHSNHHHHHPQQRHDLFPSITETDIEMNTAPPMTAHVAHLLSGEELLKALDSSSSASGGHHHHHHHHF
ncbi:hypoxia-inducible factor 1-alpha isoform X2 [Lingula anatina]|uniref:Hypoxia-inducible factor 1-alpha isoform X2 n=1 Tax=Lingula anatina TaxID=7574 RepID=A0A1S3HKF6_LINAN|nr:hypoxia-inducible factor 1-alpha isoform X2 [Lingula anatina]|eukprot:XP_013386590.1 hypoxia-inducible factor 1-alpha isoform X2 [Lingula anatina]